MSEQPLSWSEDDYQECKRQVVVSLIALMQIADTLSRDPQMVMVEVLSDFQNAAQEAHS